MATTLLTMELMYTCIFFDLDHTLWDYETNSRETLEELYHHFSLAQRGVRSVDAFQQRFLEVNTQLWERYDRGFIDSGVIRRERFKQILEAFDAYDEELSEKLSYDYLYACPKKKNLMPHAIETLTYLSDKYTLSVITNGFEEIQHQKLLSGNLTGFFDQVITSQRAGCKKPAKEIFEYAMNANKVRCHEAIMVGDNLVTDIGGARNASIHTAYFNPANIDHKEDVTYEVRHLRELCEFL